MSCMVDISLFFRHVIDSYNDTEHLRNGLLYVDPPIKDYVYTWNIIDANYTDMKSCCLQIKTLIFPLCIIVGL